MGLVTLAYVSCVTSTIVTAPIKLQYLKITKIGKFIRAITLMVMKMANTDIRVSSVVKKVGTKVFQFILAVGRG